MIIKIPFQGFYYSIHSDLIDWTTENYLDEDRYSEDQLIEFCGEFSYSKKTLDDYCKMYCKNLSKAIKINFTFESLDSPRFYNYSTDRIFANIDESEIIKMLSFIDKKEFSKLCKKRLTSRDGFISHYDPDFRNWGKVADLDHNQLGLVLECYCNQELFNGWENGLICDAGCNGELDEIIYSSFNDRMIEILENEDL